MSRTARYSVVVPTVGRPSLVTLLDALLAGEGPAPEAIVVVDDRPSAKEPLALPQFPDQNLAVLRSGGAGPAAARNAGWPATASSWVVFLDDDVIPDTGWRADLAGDLAEQPWDVGGSQGRVRVPLPPDRLLLCAALDRALLDGSPG